MAARDGRRRRRPTPIACFGGTSIWKWRCWPSQRCWGVLAACWLVDVMAAARELESQQQRLETVSSRAAGGGGGVFSRQAGRKPRPTDQLALSEPNPPFSLSLLPPPSLGSSLPSLPFLSLRPSPVPCRSAPPTCKRYVLSLPASEIAGGSEFACALAAAAPGKPTRWRKEGDGGPSARTS